MGLTIGIDLGTTNTVMAFVGKDQKPEIILSRDNERFIPSVVTRYKGNFIVGRSARNIAQSNPEKYVFSIKRLIGRRITDPELEQVSKRVQYRITTPSDIEDSDEVRVLIGDEEYSPVQISAEILKCAKADAELRLGQEVTYAVISVPAYFDDNQKSATREAGRLAGLKVRKILDEPSAAALAFGLMLDSEQDRTVVVYDMGGGTFDISVISISSGISVVEAVKGDMWLGGNVFDEALMEYVLARLEVQTPGSAVNLRSDSYFMWQLREQAEQAKKVLCNPGISSAPILILGNNSENPDVEISIGYDEFENCIRPSIEHSLNLMEEAISKANILADDVTDVLLVGGSTSIPLVRSMLSNRFGADKIRTNINSMECVAMGAAIQAQIIPFIICECGEANDDDLISCRKCGKMLGLIPIEVRCPRCQTINKGSARICIACSYELSRDAPVGNPYGIGLTDDRYKLIIPVGTRYPMGQPVYELFYTVENDQPFIAIPVYQGEILERASKNAWQGQITLTIPAAKRGPAGMPMRVGMRIDKDGILTISVIGEGSLSGVDIHVVLDRHQKAAICRQCGHRNPQEALQCADCGTDLILTSIKQARICSECNGTLNDNSENCQKCGLKPYDEKPLPLRSLKYQVMLAQAACDDLFWILSSELLVELKSLLVESESALYNEDLKECADLTSRFQTLWAETWYHDLAFCLMLSRSQAGTIQQRHELSSVFEELQIAVRLGEEKRISQLVTRIISISGELTVTMDNTICPHCHMKTAPGSKCQHCNRLLEYDGGITDRFGL